MKIVVLQKPGRFTSKDFKTNLEKYLGILKGEIVATTNFDGFTRNGWATIRVEGQDSEVVATLIARELGGAQTNLATVEANGVYEGVISENNDELWVDIGIETPRSIKARVGLYALRAQLADGKPVPERRIIEDYCLIPGTRASVRLTRVEAGVIEGWLSDIQIDRFLSWMSTGLDRIQIVDCYRHEVEAAIKQSRLERDVASLETLTLTAQSVVCKLGTDAVGLIPKLGSTLRERELNTFIPRRIEMRCRPW